MAPMCRWRSRPQHQYRNRRIVRSRPPEHTGRPRLSMAATRVDLVQKMNWLLGIIVPLITSVLLAGSLAAQQPSRTVLVIDQSSVGLPFNIAIITAIRLTLNAG